ncbi:hypothetical protein ACFL6C_11185 [Myxococcota bacterium]
MVRTNLKRTALEVGIWRRSHPTGPMSGMPLELQRNVVKLLEGHSWEEVCEAVGIGRSSLSILRKRHCEDLQLRRRVASPSRRKRRRKSRSSSGRKKTTVHLAQVVRLPGPPKHTAGANSPPTLDGRIIVELGDARVGVLDGFTPSTLGAVLDVLEARGRREA